MSISVIILSILLLVGCGMYINANTQAEELPVIIIDAGHGGEDGGATAIDGTNEKDINLQIAKYLNSFFISGGFKTVMTRTDDSKFYDDPVIGRGTTIG